MKRKTNKGRASPEPLPKHSTRRSATRPSSPGLPLRRSKAATLKGVDARILRSREALRRGLLALLEKKQFEQITIRDIAAQAKVGYATFFRHHPSKEDLLGEIAAEEIAQLMALTLPLLDARDTRVSCLALCNYVDQHRVLWSVLLAGGAAATLRAELIRLARQWAPKVRTSRWIPVELGTVSGVAATIEILSWWLHRPAGEYSAEQVAEFLDRLVVAPATAPDRGRGA
jgi:AcrR family transcriptional regulator